jgi:hypothetical protein
MDNVIKMPMQNELCDQDLVNLFMGLVRLIRRQYQNQIDDLKRQLNMPTDKCLPNL